MHTQPTSTPFLSSISRNLSSVTHTSASEPASPLPSCPSPQSHDSPVADFILWTLGNGRTTVQSNQPPHPHAQQPPSPDNTPSPRPTFAPHKSQPISQNPKNHSPVQTTLPPHAPNARTTQITAHLPKSQKSQSSPDNTPSPRAQHRRQRNHSPKITAHPSQNPKNHSPVQTTPQSRQHLHPHAQRSHHTNHSPSPKIP